MPKIGTQTIDSTQKRYYYITKGKRKAERGATMRNQHDRDDKIRRIYQYIALAISVLALIVALFR